jgi:hypothetical protein
MVAKTRAEMRVQRMEERTAKAKEITTKLRQAETALQLIGEQAGQAGAAMNLLKMILEEGVEVAREEAALLATEIMVAAAALKEDQRRRKKEAIPEEKVPTETETGEMGEGVHGSTTEGGDDVPEA